MNSGEVGFTPLKLALADGEKVGGGKFYSNISLRKRKVTRVMSNGRMKRWAQHRGWCVHSTRESSCDLTGMREGRWRANSRYCLCRPWTWISESCGVGVRRLYLHGSCKPRDADVPHSFTISDPIERGDERGTIACKDILDSANPLRYTGMGSGNDDGVRLMV